VSYTVNELAGLVDDIAKALRLIADALHRLIELEEERQELEEPDEQE